MCAHIHIYIYIYTHTQRYILYNGTLIYNETEGMLLAIQYIGENVNIDTQYPGCPIHTHTHTLTHVYVCISRGF